VVASGSLVVPISYKILSEVCQEEIFEACGVEKNDFISSYMALSENELKLAVMEDNEFRKQARKIRNVIENEVRARFGFKQVGEAWASETLLYQLASEVLPGEKVIRHYRPEFLERLELDIFFPNLQLGIEYQGAQHFQAIDHWGGKEALMRTQSRDGRKKDLCIKCGIKLVYFYHTEQLSIDLVRSKLLDAGASLK